MTKYINLFMNISEKTHAIKDTVVQLFETNGYRVSRIYRDDAHYNLVIGGDGTFLRAVRESYFSAIPFVGINTGHLGFFQEIDAANLRPYMDRLFGGDYFIDDLHMLEASITTNAWAHHLQAVNEFFITSIDNKILNLNINFDDIQLLNQAGDGIILSTAAGSTAYNLSANGAILYQTLKGYQIAMIAPVKSKRYQSIPSSIVVPSDTVTNLKFDAGDADRVRINVDGIAVSYKGLREIAITQSSNVIRRVVFDKHWYWYNLKEKLI